MMRRGAALLVFVVTVGVGAPPASGAPPIRRTYVISEAPGVLPEGIGVGSNGRLYVTSSATGAVYQGRLGVRRLKPFLPPGADHRTSALGVHADADGRVYVAGSTALDVYTARGRLLAHRPAPAGPAGAASLNDLVVSRDAVYVTDFANPVILRAERHGDRIGPLRPWLNVSSVNTALPPEYWFLNGIDLSGDQQSLLVSSQGLEALLRVDVRTREAEVIDLGDTTFAADGIVLRDRTLYAVLNYDTPSGEGVYVAHLDRTLSTGQVTPYALAGLDSPTTLALTRHSVLVVNSQLDHPPGSPPYTVTAFAVPHQYDDQ